MTGQPFLPFSASTASNDFPWVNELSALQFAI
jgi:hypothetical protein